MESYPKRIKEEIKEISERINEHKENIKRIELIEESGHMPRWAYEHHENLKRLHKNEVYFNKKQLEIIKRQIH